MRRIIKPFRIVSLQLVLLPCLAAQSSQLTVPAWLKPYQAASPEIRSSSSTLIETAYTASAQANDVIAYYRRLFEGAGLRFNPNFDGSGFAVRTAAPECDLLIQIKEQGGTTTVRTSCAAKSAGQLNPNGIITSGSPAGGASASTQFHREQAQRLADVAGLPAGTRLQTPADAERFRAELRQRMADGQTALQRHIENNAAGRGDEQVWPHSPENDPPPLVWPGWLAHVRGARLNPVVGEDQSHNQKLEAKFVTPAPMTEIYNFYEDLLNGNGFRVYSSKLGTGHTISGVVQNADGYLEGSLHPYDVNGPRTVIRVTFSRFMLNDPITVRITVTPHARF